MDERPESGRARLPVRVQADWRYEVVGARQHYLVEGYAGDAFAGRAYGWFEAGAQFVLEKIEVEPELRSNGVGSTLLHALRTQARACACVTLDIKGVRCGNTRAIDWYRSLGAVESGRTGELLDFVIAPP